MNSESVVNSLGRLVVFGVDQTGAYRELSGAVSKALGKDVSTKIASALSQWATERDPGVFVLTGNAGTGKTAALQSYCDALGQPLPQQDELTELEGGQRIAKDVSGMSTRLSRASAFRLALHDRKIRQSVLCANEGVLRDVVEDLEGYEFDLRRNLDRALLEGASSVDGVTIVNMNRQRLTSMALWDELINYVSRVDLWGGCEGCPGHTSAGDGEPGSATVGCPMQANAEALRRSDVRSVLRLLLQTVSGETVPTFREILALLAWCIVGVADQKSDMPLPQTCETVRKGARDRGASAFTATAAYYNLVFGEGIPPEARERSPLLSAIERLGVGFVADLDVDEWLRDNGSANVDIQRIAGRPTAGQSGSGGYLNGSQGPLDRVRTSVGEMTFHRLGELLSISEDTELVRATTKALVASELPVQRMWRRRVIFEGASGLGGSNRSVSRLSELVFAPELIQLSERIATGDDGFSEIRAIVRGLNFLVAGYCDAADGLIVPEPASLFARNPGSFVSARPTFVHATIDLNRIGLVVPDAGLVSHLLDVDHVEVRLEVDGNPSFSLSVGPRLYQAIREAEEFQGPVGEGVAEMTDLRSFYGRLAAGLDRLSGLQVADPSKSAIVRVQLPHFPSQGGGG